MEPYKADWDPSEITMFATSVCSNCEHEVTEDTIMYAGEHRATWEYECPECGRTTYHEINL